MMVPAAQEDLRERHTAFGFRQLVDIAEKALSPAINDPTTLKRFRHFVNSDRADDNVVFVRERGQIRPARAGLLRGGLSLDRWYS